MFQECFKGVSRKIEGYIKAVFKKVLMIFERSSKSVWKLTWCFKEVSKEFKGSLKTGSRVFQGYFKKGSRVFLW